MFKFNFDNGKESFEDKEKQEAINWYTCSKVDITSDLKEKVKNINQRKVIKLNYEGNITLTCLSPTQVIDDMKRDEENGQLLDALEADQNHSDLIPGKYEGGLKIWECTKDLVNYLAQYVSDLFKGKRVLDLGCGSGILGIVSLLKGATVTFQDYNHEVLELITIPNIYLNMKYMDIYDKTEFFSGDWASFVDIISKNFENELDDTEPSPKKLRTAPSSNKFDCILSSETIYNPENYEKLCSVIRELMKDDGMCYLAAKTCYFGVGGNTQSFIEHLRKENIFNIETCWFSNEGVAREILKITFKKNQEKVQK